MKQSIVLHKRAIEAFENPDVVRHRLQRACVVLPADVRDLIRRRYPHEIPYSLHVMDDTTVFSIPLDDDAHYCVSIPFLHVFNDSLINFMRFAERDLHLDIVRIFFGLEKLICVYNSSFTYKNGNVYVVEAKHNAIGKKSLAPAEPVLSPSKQAVCDDLLMRVSAIKDIPSCAQRARYFESIQRSAMHDVADIVIVYDRTSLDLDTIDEEFRQLCNQVHGIQDDGPGSGITDL